MTFRSQYEAGERKLTQKLRDVPILEGPHSVGVWTLKNEYICLEIGREQGVVKSCFWRKCRFLFFQKCPGIIQDVIMLFLARIVKSLPICMRVYWKDYHINMDILNSQQLNSHLPIQLGRFSFKLIELRTFLCC